MSIAASDVYGLSLRLKIVLPLTWAVTVCRTVASLTVAAPAATPPDPARAPPYNWLTVSEAMTFMSPAAELMM